MYTKLKHINDSIKMNKDKNMGTAKFTQIYQAKRAQGRVTLK